MQPAADTTEPSTTQWGGSLINCVVRELQDSSTYSSTVLKCVLAYSINESYMYVRSVQHSNVLERRARAVMRAGARGSQSRFSMSADLQVGQHPS